MKPKVNRGHFISMNHPDNLLENVSELSGPEEKPTHNSPGVTQRQPVATGVLSDGGQKEKTLSFPLKRNNTLLQETPSIFEKQSAEHQSINGFSHSPEVETKSEIILNDSNTPANMLPIEDVDESQNYKKVEKTPEANKINNESKNTALILDSVPDIKGSPTAEKISGQQKKRKKEKEKHKKSLDKKTKNDFKLAGLSKIPDNLKETASKKLKKEEGKTISKCATSNGKSEKPAKQSTTLKRHRSKSEQTTRKENHKPEHKTAEGLVAYSSDENGIKIMEKRSFPATLPRIHASKSPNVTASQSERASTSHETRAPKISKCTAKSTWDSSDSDFEADVNKDSPNPKASNEVELTSASLKENSKEVKRERSSSSSSSSSCSSRSQSRNRSHKRRHSSRSSTRSYSHSRSYTSSSATSSSRSYSRSPVSSRRRRHSPRRRRRHSSSSSDRSQGRYSVNRRRYRHRTSRSSSSSSRSSYDCRRRRNRHYSSDTSGGVRKRSISQTPPPVCRRTCAERQISGSISIPAVTRSPPESRLARLGVGPVGKTHKLLSTRAPGHKTSKTVAAAANAAVRKITGAAYCHRELSPQKNCESIVTDTEVVSKCSSQKTVEDCTKLNVSASEDDTSQSDKHTQYIGPQVPPEMAKKLGLSVEGSSEQVGTSSDAHWKAHVGAKRKSDRGLSDNCSGKRQDNGDSKSSLSLSSFDVFPPEKAEEYKALQAQAKEHALRRGQPISTADLRQQQVAAALVAQSTSLQQQQHLALLAQFQQQHNQAAVVSTAPVTVMTSQPVMSAGVLEQLRQQQQLYAMAGASGQAAAIEALIRQYQLQYHQQQQQVESMQAATQQQQMLQLFALAQQQATILATQQPSTTVISAATVAQQQAILLAAAQQQQNAESMSASLQQQALLQRILQHRQQVLAAANNGSPMQQQQQLQIMLYLQQQQQQQQAIQAHQQQVQAGAHNAANLASICATEASTGTAVKAIGSNKSTDVTGEPSMAVATSNVQQVVTTPQQPPTASSPSLMAAVAVVAAQQRNIRQNEQLQKQLAAAVWAKTTGANLTAAQQQQHSLLTLQAAAVAAQQQRPQQLQTVGQTQFVDLAVAQQQAAVQQQQQQMAQMQILYQQAAAVGQQQQQALYQQQAAVVGQQQQQAATLAAQQQVNLLTRLMRPQ